MRFINEFVYLILICLPSSAMCYETLVRGLKNYSMFYRSPIESWLNDELQKLKIRNKYYTKQITERQNKIKKIDQILIMEKLYLDENISLTALAGRVLVSNNYLSRLINEQTNLGFYDFINRYRVEEAKKMIENIDDDNINFLKIGYECGFKSKSTFNRAFRKFTKISPTEYRIKKSKDKT